MDLKQYDARVVAATFDTVAREEGRLRGLAVASYAAADRMQADLDKLRQGEDVDAVQKLAASVKKRVAEATVMVREADAIRARVEKAIADAPQPPEKKHYTLEDVIQTLQEQHDREFIPPATRDTIHSVLVRLRRQPPEMNEARELLLCTPWPPGVDAYIGACLKVLDALIAGRPTPTY